MLLISRESSSSELKELDTPVFIGLGYRVSDIIHELYTHKCITQCQALHHHHQAAARRPPQP